MERRTKLPALLGKGVKAFIGKTEKQCNKCGFVTLCLHVLYKHKHKCRGQLLGHPIVCSYCKRKFNFAALYRAHKVTCVKKIRKQVFLKLKLREKHLKYKEEQQKQASSEFSFSCPICQTSFKSKFKFVSHLKEQKCKTQVKVKKPSFSARKSFNNHKTPNHFQDQFDSSILKKRKYSFLSENDDEQTLCKWCRCLYPSQKLLLQHLEFNKDCAKAYYKTKYSNAPKKVPFTARKTMSTVAKKSFPHKRHKIDIFSNKKVSGSARKSLPSSREKLETYKGKSENFRNPCPVCFKEFTDTFSFFQHQKEMNHWGKATKSANSTCKCPFCGKEFFHVTARNIHIRNHSDVSQDEIKAFLRSQICSVCSESFASELAKQQHIRMKHPSHPLSINTAKYSASVSEPNTPNNDYASKHKMSSVPSSVKKKLKQQPNTCPICSKAFSHTVLRNKHFNEVHLKIFECQFCNTKFKSISSLNNHIELSHGKDYECRECKVRLKNELQLLQHVLKSHPNKDPKLFLPVKQKNSSPKEKSQDITEGVVKSTEKVNFNVGVPGKNMEYYCDVCDIGYLKLCGLQRHRQSKLHKDTLERNLDAVQKSLSDLPPSPQTANPRIVKQPEIITCSECSEEFTTIKDFVPHRLSHFSFQGKYLKISELNPYMCEVCSEVLNSHSKVQLHLFWHLQIESTTNINNNFGSNKKDTIVPDRLSGQHVAKKSFSKQSNESFQEVVIGGVSKPLFTCEACNIGFTTKAHYSMHVRKLCKKINSTKASSKTAKLGSATSNNKANSIQDDIVHCRKCNFLFSTPAKHGQHKPYCSKCYHESNSEECLCNSDAIKSALQRDIAVAGCITCGAIFDTVMNVAEHLNVHQEESDNSINEDVPEDVLHCALCNCLFPLQAFKVHKDFCKIPVNIGDKVSNSKHMNVLKSALELKCAVAGCISCGVPFDDLETFVKHLTLHQTNQIQNEPLGRGLCNGEETSIDGVDVENEDSSVVKPTEILDFADHSFELDEEHLNSSKSICYTSDSGPKTDNLSSVPIVKEKDNSIEIEQLRENFSLLLCLLISDPELMQTLGFGTLSAEDVLINVLQQMGQECCTDETSNLDRFRKNIQILLDLCLKEQIMEAIGNKKTIDEIVIEALKIFTSDESIPDADELSTV